MGRSPWVQGSILEEWAGALETIYLDDRQWDYEYLHIAGVAAAC
ncbi:MULTISPECIES: hypothetical protein [unclassified Pseudomonas]|nr:MULTISPECIES: hypothetical protein [unclassified Pseudomonas]